MGDLPRRIGRYAVVRELGRGGMGVVYEVRHPEIPRPLALKQVLASAVTPEALLRFAREGQLLARVSHRGVVRVHQLEHGSQGPFLVTDLVEGRPLEELARDGRLAPREAARLVREVADAVVALHAAGVIHRDLKGTNVLVQRDGQPVLVDFGLGRDVQAADSLTRTGTVLGTPTHMSPEQAAGGAIGEATDAWGLGALLFEALTGRPPFLAETVTETLRQVLHEEPPSPARLHPEVPRALDDLARRTLVKDPADRPSAAALRDALDAYLRGESGPPPRRRGLVAALGGAALLLALLALRPGPAPGPPEPAPSPTPIAPAAGPPPAAPRAGVVASIAARARSPVPCLVETLPRATRGAFTGDHLVTWTPRGRELRVWRPAPSGALAARTVPVDDPIAAVCVDPDLPPGHPPIVAVITTRRLLTLDLLGGAPVDVARAPEGQAGLVLDPPRLVFGAETHRLSLLGLRGDPDARPRPLQPAPIQGLVRTLAAGSGTFATIDEGANVFVWKTHPAAEGISAQVAGRSLAVAHGRALVGSVGEAFLFARDMTPLGTIDTGQPKAPVDAVALARGTAALLVGPSLLLAGEVGPPWATLRRQGADALALDPTGRVALVTTPGGVQVWLVGHSLTPFAATGDNGLAPLGTLPALDPPVGEPPRAAWLEPERLVVASSLPDGRRRLRWWELDGAGQARPAMAFDDSVAGLAAIGTHVVVVEAPPLALATARATDLLGSLLLAPAPGEAALVGLSPRGELRRATVDLSPLRAPPTVVGLRVLDASPCGLAVARGGRVALASTRDVAAEFGDLEGVVELWDPGGAPGRGADRTLRFPSGTPTLAFSPDGEELAIAYRGGALFVVDAAAAKDKPDPARSLGEPDTSPFVGTGVRYVHRGWLSGVAFLGDDGLASVSSLAAEGSARVEHELRRWRRTSSGWASVGSPRVWSDGALRTGLVASPDGRRLAVLASDGRVELFAVAPLR